MVLCDLEMRVLWWCEGVVGGGSVGVAQCVHRRPVDAAVVGERVCVCRWCAEGRYSISVCCDEDEAEEWRRSQLRGLCCAVQRLTDREGSGRSGRSGQVRSGPVQQVRLDGREGGEGRG